MVLTTAWKLEGFWKGVDVDRASGDIYAAISTHGRPDDLARAEWEFRPDGAGTLFDGRAGAKVWFTSVWRINRAGQKGSPVALREFEAGTGRLRTAHLTGRDRPDLVLFEQFNHRTVRAFDPDGHALWTYQPPSPYGVKDACIADLDGDGRDEVITVDKGTKAIDADGKIRWTSNAGYWSVTAANTGADRKAEVIAGAWDVQFLDSRGRLRHKVKGVDAGWSIRAAFRGPQEEPIIICQEDYLHLVGVDPSGLILWQKRDNYSTYTVDAAAAPDRPWIAYALKDGTVLIYDTRTGEHLASVRSAGACPTLAWAAASSDLPPLLLVASGYGLEAFTLQPAATVSGAKTPDATPAVDSR